MTAALLSTGHYSLISNTVSASAQKFLEPLFGDASTNCSEFFCPSLMMASLHPLRMDLVWENRHDYSQPTESAWAFTLGQRGGDTVKQWDQFSCTACKWKKCPSNSSPEGTSTDSPRDALRGNTHLNSESRWWFAVLKISHLVTSHRGFSIPLQFQSLLLSYGLPD